jgi:hypothetical protein
LLASRVLVVDACRSAVRNARAVVSLARRPGLFELVRALAEEWHGDVLRGSLLARAFRARRVDESHRVRSRVEVGRLRSVLRAFAGLRATKQGFKLKDAEGAASKKPGIDAIAAKSSLRAPVNR